MSLIRSDNLLHQHAKPCSEFERQWTGAAYEDWQDTAEVIANVNASYRPNKHFFINGVLMLCETNGTSFRPVAGASAWTDALTAPYSVLHGSFIGGGNLTAGNNLVKWSQRFIHISLNKGPQIPSGFYDILMPPNGTIIHGEGGMADITVANGEILLGAWNVLWYELPLSAPSATNNNNFHVSAYTAGNFAAPSHWVAVARHSGDTDTVTFCDERKISAGGVIAAYDFRGNSAWVSVPHTNITAGVNHNFQVRLEGFGTFARMRGRANPTNNTVGGFPVNAVLGVLPTGYIPQMGGGWYSNGQRNVAFVLGQGGYQNIVATPIFGYADGENGTIGYFDAHGGCMEMSVDVQWTVI